MKKYMSVKCPHCKQDSLSRINIMLHSTDGLLRCKNCNSVFKVDDFTAILTGISEMLLWTLGIVSSFYFLTVKVLIVCFLVSFLLRWIFYQRLLKKVDDPMKLR
jgi:phage FluMu protein Com